MLWLVFDLDTPISLLLVICLLVLLFAVSVVGCLLGYSSCLVVWIPLFLDPSDGAFGRFDLAALCGCRTLNFCLFVCSSHLASIKLLNYVCCFFSIVVLAEAALPLEPAAAVLQSTAAAAVALAAASASTLGLKP